MDDGCSRETGKTYSELLVSVIKTEHDKLHCGVESEKRLGQAMDGFPSDKHMRCRQEMIFTFW